MSIRFPEKTVTDFGPFGAPHHKRLGSSSLWGPTTSFLYLCQARRRKEYLRITEMTAESITKEALRNSEGLAGTGAQHETYVDTMYFTCRLLAGMGKSCRKPEYVREAANQLLLIAGHLQDPATGLFWHVWDWNTAKPVQRAFWGRGNGWILMALADTFEALPTLDRLYVRLTVIAEKQARGFEATEDSDGLWHTIMDDFATYQEASASSMAVCGLLTLVRLKVLPPGYRKPAWKAWAAVNERFVRNGVVTGVSTGTEAGANCRSIELGTYPWGTGSCLLAGCEVSRLR